MPTIGNKFPRRPDAAVLAAQAAGAAGLDRGTQLTDLIDPRATRREDSYRSVRSPMSSIERLKERLPDHAKDLRVNLCTITSSTSLKPQQAWGTALACAVASRNAEVVAAIAADAPLSPEAAAAARGAAAIMAMNNIYTRFQHMMGDGSPYAQLPVRLRMQIIGRPGVDHVDFELWCLAASVINGCEHSVRTHENTVRERGGTEEQVQDAVRIAAVIHAVALTLDTVPAPPPIVS
jgi:alkyl hydroperoxide reductase subunit D